MNFNYKLLFPALLILILLVSGCLSTQGGGTSYPERHHHSGHSH